jgi:hypothetical protein
VISGVGWDWYSESEGERDRDVKVFGLSWIEDCAGGMKAM